MWSSLWFNALLCQHFYFLSILGRSPSLKWCNFIFFFYAFRKSNSINGNRTLIYLFPDRLNKLFRGLPEERVAVSFSPNMLCPPLSTDVWTPFRERIKRAVLATGQRVCEITKICKLCVCWGSGSAVALQNQAVWRGPLKHKGRYTRGSEAKGGIKRNRKGCFKVASTLGKPANLVFRCIMGALARASRVDRKGEIPVLFLCGTDFSEFLPTRQLPTCFGPILFTCELILPPKSNTEAFISKFIMIIIIYRSYQNI